MTKFEQTKREILERRKKKNTWKKIVSFLCCICIFVTAYGLVSPAITLSTDVLYCAKEAHTHTEECYSQELICEKDEHIHSLECYEFEKTLICDEDHEHEDSCYDVIQNLVCKEEEHNHVIECHSLTCDKEQHTHKDICYSNLSADKDPQVWLDKLPELVGDWKLDLANVAKSQVGYEESTTNFVLDEEIEKYYNIYSAEYGDGYADWNLSFVNWCLNKSDIPSSIDNAYHQYVPQVSGVDILMYTAMMQNVYTDNTYPYDGVLEYVPEIGDIAFILNENYETLVGIVTNLNYEDINNTNNLISVEIVIGDIDGKTIEIEYRLDDEDLIGFINVPNIVINKNEQNEESDETTHYYHFGGDDEIGANAWVDDSLLPGFSLFGETPSLGDGYVELTNSQVQAVLITWKHPNDTSDTWNSANNLPEGTTIPANAIFKIAIDYAHVEPSDLQNGTQTLSKKLYYKVDDVLKNIDTTGKVYVDGEEKGIIQTETKSDGTYIVIQFDNEWITDIVNNNHNTSGGENYKTIAGDFYYQGSLDLSEIDNQNSNIINLAGININVPDKSDALAKYASVDFNKSIKNNKQIEKIEDYYYITYEIEVKAGEYGCPDVKLIDTLNCDGSDFIVKTFNSIYDGGYQNITCTSKVGEGEPQSASITYYLTNDLKPTKVVSNDITTYVINHVDNGSNIAFKLGDLAANETRTITYKVRLNSSYIGVPRDNIPVNNTARLFSKEYPRGIEEENYKPNMGVDTGKSSEITDNGDGTFTINYTITVTAKANNSNTLTNVKINDLMNYDGYHGSAYKSCITSITNPVVKKSDNTTYPQTPNVNLSNKTFTAYIGDLEPGETKTITYSITFNPSDAELIANGDVRAYNKVNVMSDDTKNEQLLGSRAVDDKVTSHTWTSKSSPSQVLQDTNVTINPADKVFNLTSGTLTEITSNKPTSTTINAGTFRYTVEINRDGTWDTKAANMHDGFGTNEVNGINVHLLQFDGYLKIEAYPKTDNNNAIQGHMPAKTYWVNINDLTSFDLKAEDIVDAADLSANNYAYKLTYYAKFSNQSDWGKAYVSNSFNLSGSVIGNGGTPVTLAGITQTITTTFIEPGSETPTKSFWYYDKTDNAFDNFKINGQNNGALYWYASVGGSKVSKGTVWEESVRIKDKGNWAGGDENAPRSLIRKNPGTDNGPSYLGFYLIDTRDDNGNQRNFSDVYEDYTSFLTALESADSKIEEVSSDKYRVEFSRNFLSGTDKSYWDFSITFTESYAIPEGKMLYMLVRTQPSVMPGPNSSLDYVNKINYKTTSMSGWEFPKASTMIHSESDGVYKKTGGVYDIKNNTINLIPGSGIDQTNKILGNVVNLTTDDQNLNSINSLWPGHSYEYNGNVTYADGKYITWYITANKLKTLNGDYYVEDYLPAGLDLVYVRPYDVKSVFRKPSASGSSASADDLKRWNTFYIGPGLTTKTDVIPTNLLNGTGINVNSGWCFTPNGVIDNIGDEWKLHLTASACDNNSNYVYTGDNRTALIYYTRNNQTTGGTDIKMFFPYMTPGETDVTVQVVAKLNSDSSHDLLFGDLDFNNQVALYDTTGKLIDERGAEVTIGGGNVSKNLLTDGLFKDSDSSTIIKTAFPYSININSERADMVSDSDYITLPLIDRMTSNLSIINSTLKIYKNEAIDDLDHLLYYGGIYTDNSSANGKPWHVETSDPKIGKSVGYLGTGTPIVVSLKDSEDTTGKPFIGPNGSQMKEIRFTNLPDETHLIISYSVSATIANSNNVFKNEAYWEGYEDNKDGDTEINVNKYEAQSSAQIEQHGAIHIMKYDANDESNRLAGAEFKLYRAKYVEASSDKLAFTSDTTDAVKAKRYLAVYMGNDYSETSTDPEVKVIRDNNGHITEFYQPGQDTPTPINNIKTLGIKLHHKLELDSNGNIQYYNDEVLASGKTDANGNLSYGFTSDYGVDITGDDKNRIHFNKIYCLIETKAPTGYDPDPTEHYFVIPSDKPQNNGQGDNYFYHEQWPSGVHVCTLTENGMPTYVLGIPNYKQQLKVTKNFQGTNHVYKPATYEFGIWNVANGINPTKDTMLYKTSVTFTEDDFGYYDCEDIYEYEHNDSLTQYRRVGSVIEYRNVTNNHGVYTYGAWQQSDLTDMPSGVTHWKYYKHYLTDNGKQKSRLIKEKVGSDVIITDEFTNLPDGIKIPDNLTYGILPGHMKSALFPVELNYGEYYVYELNDSGYAITSGKGTIGGQTFTVSITGDACTSGYGKIEFNATKKDVMVTNQTYSINVTKKFKDAGGKDLDSGLLGTYKFAIWPEEEVVDGLPITSPTPSKIKTITWTLSDTETEKACEFTDLQGSKNYYVFELDANNNPIADSSVGIVNGNIYVVNYDSKNTNHSITTTIGTTPNVVVSNSSTITLPETGGLGSEKLTKIGLLLVSFTVLTLINKKGQ